MVAVELLNKKLAEFAEFNLHYNEYLSRWRWQTPDGEWDIDFTNPDTGIAYCFKYLVPKLVWSIWLINAGNGWEFHIIMPMRHIVGKAETPALALCKAIEKLIDSRR